jgi:hypothetical protein
MTDETLKQNTDAVLQAIAELSKKIDVLQSDLTTFKQETNAQFEAIRDGIEHNHVISERMQGDIHYLRADVGKISIELRKDKLALK